MKNLTFSVTISFEDKITDDFEIAEVGQNILTAIVREAEVNGISPENSETFATKVSVGIDGWENEIII